MSFQPDERGPAGAEEGLPLHDAQLAVAREHGMSSWAALKEHIVAAEAERSHALAQVRWVIGRFAGADAPGWTAPTHDELSDHFTEQFLGPRRDVVEEMGLGWGLRRSMDAAGQVGIGPGWAASLITRPTAGRTIAVLTNRLFPVLALNVELVRAVA